MMPMLARSLGLLAAGSGLGLLLGILIIHPAEGEEAPDALRDTPAKPSARARELSRPFVEATRRVRPTVVKIYNYQRRGRSLRLIATGSGSIISPKGHILTNRHVVLDAGQLIVELDDGRKFRNIKMIGKDPRSDVAVIRINEAGLEPLPVAQLGDSDELAVGEWVIAIGAPFQLASSVSVGVVSATGRTNVLRQGTSQEFIQTDAALNPGNSGGPLINLDGQVVGINTAIQTGGRSESSAGVGFAVPINLARTVAISLIEKGVAKRGWLGVGLKQDSRGFVRVYTRNELKRIQIDAPSGAMIEYIQPDSPGAKSGLKRGDVITAVDGRSILNLHARLAQAGPGGILTLTIGGKRDIKVTLAEERLESTYGIEVEDLDAAKAGVLGLHPSTKGVVVSRIQEQSVAARANMRNRLMPGDVITRVAWLNRVQIITTKLEFEQLMARFQSERPRFVRFYFRTKEGEYKADLIK